MLLHRETLIPHRRWAVATLLATLVAVVWYGVWASQSSRWPGGSSLPGLVFGTLGSAIILFEFLLWPRKKLRWLRLGRAQIWMRAHIWLGLLTVPLIVLHSGFRWGGTLTTALMVLFWIVIGSGLFGLLAQQWLPRLMFETIPAETIYSQIDPISRQYAVDAEALMLATCGPAKDVPVGSAAGPVSDETAEVGQAHVVIGAVRTTGRVRGKVLQTVAKRMAVANSEPLRATFQAEIKPFLERGSRCGSPLSNAKHAADLFRELKARLDPTAHAAVEDLETWCDHRRQFDRQRRLHWWLHSWLSVHLPLSFALVLLMVVHIFVAVKYW